MESLPTVRLGSIQITRLIIGGNPFCGVSHQSKSKSREMVEFFTADKVVETLQHAEALGINTFQGRGDFHRVMYWLELFKRQGGNLHWIAQTASEMHSIPQNIRVIAAAGADAIYHHGSETDGLWKQDKKELVRERLKVIRDTGCAVGLGTHMPEVIEYAEERDWDVDFYMACFYNLSRIDRHSALVDAGPEQPEPFYDEDPRHMCKTIRATDKTCLAFKILGAGRRCGTQEEVAGTFRYAFSSIKEKDAVVVGVYPRHEDQIALNVRYALDAIGVPQR
jgi:hypothetical protein